MSALPGARAKLAEARFFLALLKRIESGQTVTPESLDDEATYFMSALLNACYSVMQHLGKQGKQALRAAEGEESRELDSCLGKEVDDVRKRNRVLYYKPRRGESSEESGLRHLSVHHEVVAGKHRERTMGTWGSAMWGEMMFGEVRVVRRLYVDDPHSEAPVWIIPRMTEHVRELEELVTRWENHIAGLDDGGAPSCLARG